MNGSENNVRKLLDLTGKVALVTGASIGGIGFSIAEALAEAGVSVVISDVSSRVMDLHMALDRLKKIKDDSKAIEIDITDSGSVIDGIKSIDKEFGQLNILINNAGIIIRKPSLEMTREEWQKVIDTNLTGTWFISNEVARLMIRKGYSKDGRIINVASQLGKVVGDNPESSYYASKAAIIHLTRALAMEWAPYGINVNCIAPGVFYPTKMTMEFSKNPLALNEMIKRTMKGRLGDPSKDLKGVAVFLASAASDYITGQTIYVDGGWTAW
ncbi:MAG: SDR family oxidoreductase [Thermoplasmatales archaeon]